MSLVYLTLESLRIGKETHPFGHAESFSQVCELFSSRIDQSCAFHASLDPVEYLGKWSLVEFFVCHESQGD